MTNVYTSSAILLYFRKRSKFWLNDQCFLLFLSSCFVTATNTDGAGLISWRMMAICKWTGVLVEQRFPSQRSFLIQATNWWLEPLYLQSLTSSQQGVEINAIVRQEEEDEHGANLSWDDLLWHCELGLHAAPCISITAPAQQTIICKLECFLTLWTFNIVAWDVFDFERWTQEEFNRSS